MAKTGLKYYNVDTDRYQDMRIKRLKKDNSPTGIAVYDYLLCEIYRVRGCVLEWDENTAFDVAEYFGLKETQVQEIVKYCGAVGLFDKELLSRGILTSRSIQQRYLDMCRKAKRTDAKIPDQYSLIREETAKLSEETPKVREETPKVREVFDQSKIKENISPPIIPPLAGGDGKEAEIFSLLKANPNALTERDGIQRNYPGLIDALKTLGIPGREAAQICIFSNYGQIGHPVWRLILQCRDSATKRPDDKTRIKYPGKYIISQLSEPKE